MKTLLLTLAIASFGIQEQAPRAIDLLEASGHKYDKTGGNSWAVNFEGNNQKQIRVFVVQVDEVIALVSVLALKDEIADRVGLMESLLKANNTMDYVKTTIDSDEDYTLRSDLQAAGLDGKRFAALLMQLANATDALNPAIDKFRKQ